MEIWVVEVIVSPPPLTCVVRSSPEMMPSIRVKSIGSGFFSERQKCGTAEVGRPGRSELAALPPLTCSVFVLLLNLGVCVCNGIPNISKDQRGFLPKSRYEKNQTRDKSSSDNDADTGDKGVTHR